VAKKITVFLSYAREDRPLAERVKRELERDHSTLGVYLFEDYRSNRPGDEWFRNIKRALREAKLILVLATPVSLAKPWVHFEAGAAQGMGRRLVPLCGYGLGVDDLPAPLNFRQAIDLANLQSVDRLFRVVAEECTAGRRNEKADAAVIVEEASKPKVGPHRLLAQARDAGVSALLSRRSLSDPRHELTWSDLVGRCSSILRIVGWSCQNVVSGATRDAFAELVSRPRRRLQFLVLSQSAVLEATSLNFGPVCNTVLDTVRKDLEKGIGEMRRFARQLSPRPRARVEVRETDWIMSWSAVTVDARKQDGLIQVELYAYNVPLELRPVLILSHSQKGYYPVFRRSIDSMWKHAKKVTLS